MQKHLKKIVENEKARFLITGGFNTVFGYLVFVVIQWSIGRYITYIGSLYLSHLVASSLAFYIYRKFVFQVHGHIIRDFLRFQTVYVVPLVANTFLLPVIIISSHLNVYLAQAIATFILVLISYFGHKYFSFRRPKQFLNPEEPPNVSYD